MWVENNKNTDGACVTFRRPGGFLSPAVRPFRYPPRHPCPNPLAQPSVRIKYLANSHPHGVYSLSVPRGSLSGWRQPGNTRTFCAAELRIFPTNVSLLSGGPSQKGAKRCPLFMNEGIPGEIFA
jgi:hypothetical protein